MWSFSGGVTLNFCSSKFFFYHSKNKNKYLTLLLSNNFYDPHFMLYQCKYGNFNIQHNKSFIVYKMAMGIFFTNLKKS